MRRKLRERDAEIALTGLRFGEGGLWRRIEVACHVDGPLTHLTPLLELAAVADGSREHA